MKSVFLFVASAIILGPSIFGACDFQRGGPTPSQSIYFPTYVGNSCIHQLTYSEGRTEIWQASTVDTDTVDGAILFL